MVIVDSSVWIDYFADARNSQTDWLDGQLGSQPIGVADLILCEVLQGIRDEITFAQVRKELLRFEIFDAGGLSLAVAAAHNFRFLRRQGHTVRKTIDCLIATLCIESNFELLHRDRDFEPFEQHLGLRVIHP